MSSLLHYEEFADQCADIFRDRLTEFARSGQTVDLHHWLQCYAFDVIGDITFGQRFGTPSILSSHTTTNPENHKASSTKAKTSKAQSAPSRKSWPTAR